MSHEYTTLTDAGTLYGAGRYVEQSGVAVAKHIERDGAVIYSVGRSVYPAHDVTVGDGILTHVNGWEVKWMTAAEYKAERTQRGTQERVAAQLGVARGTVARRERGALPIPREAELALLALPKTKKRPPGNPNAQVSRCGENVAASANQPSEQ
jgi:hypothetical protein